MAGFLTAFTVPVVGEMPAGEIVLLATAAWAGLCAALNGAVPGELFLRRDLRMMLVCQLVAFAGYVVADLYWHSAPVDVARGWSRMVFLGIDLLALTYLFDRSPRNFGLFLGAQLCGDVVQVLLFGALFGDIWKFGIGIPLTYAVIFLASFAGAAAVAVAALALGLLHFFLDFRSAGGLCVALAAVASLQLLPQRRRIWALPLGAVTAVALVGAVYRQTSRDSDPERTARSDVDRTAMLQAAVEAVRSSPFIGHGSWFSRSHVYDNFLEIREEKAQEAGVGGFVGPNEEPEALALHSQFLVALAEGGILGGAFFFVYGAGIVRALFNLALRQGWHRENAVRALVLLFAFWNLFMSPFSGAHRVNIAMTAALLLLMRPGRPGTETVRP